MRVKFYLDKPNAPKTSIVLSITAFGERIRFGTGLSIDPKHWNADNQEPRVSDPHRNANSRQLSVITSTVNELFDQLQLRSSNKLVSRESLKEFQSRLRDFLTPEEGRKTVSAHLVDHFNEFISTYTMRSSSGLVTAKRPGDSAIQKYKLVLSTLEDWSKVSRKPLEYQYIDLEFFVEYSRWLSQTRGINDSTVSNYIKVVKTFMKWARQKNYHTNTEYEKFYRDKRTAETIALTVDEIRAVRDCDLTDSPRLSRVRDHFLMQCLTGMRYGDLMKLEPKHFDETAGVIRFTTQKTDTACIVPITAPLKDLLAQYPSRLFEFASDVKQNMYLKELGKRLGMEQTIITSKYVEGKRIECERKKYELLTTHVARRSYATTSLRFGVPESVIAVVTGHAAKGSLQQHYLKFDEAAVRDIVNRAWEQL